MIVAIAPLRVFISSTWADLQDERAAVRDLLHRLNGLQFVGMEHFGADDQDPERLSLSEVDRAELYVGVIGLRYGSGITELEYRRAGERGLPRLIYVQRADPAEADADDAGDSQQRAQFVSQLLRQHTCVWFDSPGDLAFKLSLDLHNQLFERHLAGGIGPLSSDYLARVQDFVKEYTGTVGLPVPFGGRQAELAALDDWLADAGSPACLLVAAAAGRGKSALLVRWTRQLLGSGTVVPLFFPVSVRFGTSTAGVAFKSLLSYLSALHGKAAAFDAAADVESLRGRLADLMRRPLPDGRRLVVVLDGLDEAADWEAGPDLLPPQPGPHLRVVVSARQLAGDTDATGWLERLGWDGPGAARALLLPGLAAREVADALAGMEAPLSGLATRDEFVGEMHRLSEGDPLLVRLYVDHLREQARLGQALSLAELRRTPAGLDGYFTRWWRDQERLWGSHRPLEKLQVQALMDLLANAFGPLSHDDLLGLAPPGAPWSSWALRQAVDPLRRFVVGDGQESGYVLSHPRLALHLRERMARREREAIDERFVQWCEQCLGACDPDSANGLSPYVVQFFGTHLDRLAPGAARYAALLGDTWWRAWLALEGSTAGYRADLVRVQQALARDPGGAHADRCRLAARCALCIASVDEVARSTPSRLVADLVRHGLWGRAAALQYARAIDSPAERAAALIDLAADEPLAQRGRIAHDVLLDLDKWFDGCEAALETLGRLAPWLPPASLDQALAMALRPASLSARSRALGKLLPCLAPRQLDLVLHHVRRLRDPGDRQDLLRTLARVRPRPALALFERPELERWDALWMLMAALPGLDPAERRLASQRCLQVLQEMNLVSGLRTEPSLRRAAVELATHGDAELRPTLLQALQGCMASVARATERPKLLFDLARLSPPEVRETLITQAFDALVAAPSAARLDSVRASAAGMGPDEAMRAQDAISGDATEPGWGLAMAALLPRLPAPRRPLAVAGLMGINDPLARFEACTLVCDELSPDQASALAEAIRDEDAVPATQQFDWLRALARRLPAAGIEKLRRPREPFEHDDERWMATLAALAAHGHDTAPGQLLQILQHERVPIETAMDYVEHWAAAAPAAALEQLARDLAARIEATGGGNAALRRALAGIAGRVDRLTLQQAVRALQVIGDGWWQAMANCFELMPAAVVLEQYTQAWQQLSDDSRGQLAVGWWAGGDRPGQLPLARVLALLRAMRSDEVYLRCLRQLLEAEGQASPDLVEETAAAVAADPTGVGRATQAWRIVCDHLPEGALVQHFGIVLRSMLEHSLERAMAMAMQVPVPCFVAAYAACVDRLSQASAVDANAGTQLTWASAHRFAWQLSGDHRQAAIDVLRAATHLLSQRDRAQLVAELMPDTNDSDDERRGLITLAATVTHEPWHTQVDIALLPVAGVGALPRALPDLLRRLDAMDERRRQELALTLPDSVLQDLARAGAWRAALALHAAGSGGLPVYGQALEQDLLAVAWWLWQQRDGTPAEAALQGLRQRRDLALALVLTLLPTLGTRSLRMVSAATLRVLRRWTARDGSDKLIKFIQPNWTGRGDVDLVLVAEWVFRLLREWLGEDGARNIRVACTSRAELHDPPSAAATLIGLVQRGVLHGHALALLDAWAGSEVDDKLLRNAEWLEQQVRDITIDRLEHRTALLGAGAGPRRSRLGHRLLRAPRRQDPSRAWLLLLESASGLGWSVLRTAGRLRDRVPDARPPAPAPDSGSAQAGAPRRPRRAEVVAALLDEARLSGERAADLAGALAEAVVEASRRWP